MKGEGDYGRKLAGGQGRGPEDALQGGQVDQRDGERRRDGDPGQ
jgi:hypothetical protein